MYSTYLRLGLHVADSDIAVIRASRAIVARKHRRSPAMRDERKKLYRLMIRHHKEARQLYRDVMLNDIQDA